MGETIKSQRLSLRLDPSSKDKIERAAALSHRSVNNFILNSVLKTAEEVIQESETILLNDQDRDLFLEALSNPPEPNEALKTALAMHEKAISTNG